MHSEISKWKASDKSGNKEWLKTGFESYKRFSTNTND